MTTPTMLVAILVLFFVGLGAFILSLRTRRGEKFFFPHEPRKKLWGKVRLWTVIVFLIVFPLAAIPGWIFLEKAIYYDPIDARVTGIERVCVVTEPDGSDLSEAMSCDQARAERDRSERLDLVADRARVNYVFLDADTGEERTGHAVSDLWPSIFRIGDDVSVRHPSGWEGPGRDLSRR